MLGLRGARVRLGGWRRGAEEWACLAERDISLCRECALRRENVADGLRVGYNQGFVTTVGAVQRIPAGPTRP